MGAEDIMCDFVATGDERAFNALHRLYNAQLVGYFTRKVGHATACDVVQDVWVKVHKNAHTYTGTNVRAWLYTIARRVTVDHIRVQRRQDRNRDESGDVGDATTCNTGEHMEGLDSLLAPLDARCREVVVRMYVGGQTGHEVAACMGIPVSTAFYAAGMAKRTLGKVVA